MKCYEVVKIDGKARGIIARDLVSGQFRKAFWSRRTIMYGWIW